ncbi:HD superfamily hydrolase [Lachnospiraceae bacterium KM106-2]|nr:HD superfamily hydrolase [Lachnospiraceae bacterium KM106-2]
MNLITEVYTKMIAYFANDPKRIQHFTKVHSYAKLIGELEEIDDDTMFILETAALVHDIGIKKAELECHSSNGKLQEKYGPDEAKFLLMDLNYDAKIIDRVCYLVGHHHTYNKITGLDYQILVEADFLVNLYEDGLNDQATHYAYTKIFQTKSGKALCTAMFGN